MRKSYIHRFESTTLEERWADYLNATGKTKEEMPLKAYAELEYKVFNASK